MKKATVLENAPSKTGEKSGGARSNNPPKATTLPHEPSKKQNHDSSGKRTKNNHQKNK